MYLKKIYEVLPSNFYWSDPVLSNLTPSIFKADILKQLLHFCGKN